MHLLADWAKARRLPLPVALTVDHGLQPGSRKTAQRAVESARQAGLSAHLLAWRGPKPEADIEAAARLARYALMGRWCRSHGIGGLYVAHTLEDQAETFLLRLARGSGLDGLSGMRALAPYPLLGFDNLGIVRPLLAFEREALRGFLRERRVAWDEDPMNGDPRFARVRMRQAGSSLAELGLTAQRIAIATGHLARARDALEGATLRFLERACRFEDAGAILDGGLLGLVAPEIGLRALATVLSRVGEQPYRPRFERLERLYALIRDDKLTAARTLHGCRVGPAPRRAAIFGKGSLSVLREKPRASRP
jgi:tRNA(Ile)-lysidine synthase